MLRKLRPRSVYDVFAVLALFVAVGGTGAYAANTVFSTDIVDGEVKAADIGSGEVGSIDVKDNSINTFDVHSFLGNDVVDNTLTGADVDESSLNLAAEPWREVGTPGQPSFTSFAHCSWSNIADAQFDTAAFLRDRLGFVHLKGLVRSHSFGFPGCDFGGFDDHVVFTLPLGYRPAKRNVNVTLQTDMTLSRVDVFAFGYVYYPGTVPSASQWVSLDGISFRCAPSGSNGCP